MKRTSLFPLLLRVLTLLTVLLLSFIIYFIVRESLPLFQEVSLADFLLGTRWKPVSYSGEPTYGILPLIAATFYVSVLSVGIAAFFGLGAALYLSFIASARMRFFLQPALDLLAGIPSVIYGFIGLSVLVKLVQTLGQSSGESVLVASIVLSVMILPFFISACTETMLQVRRRYLPASVALGVSSWFAIAHLVLPLSRRGILTSLILAAARAMGETMAVMMVMGNAAVFPTLLGKGETIPSLIALEMGTAEVGSPHFHALYAAGLVLMVLLLLINAGVSFLWAHTLGKEVPAWVKN